MTLLRQYRFASFMLVIVSIIAFSIATVDFLQLFLAVTLAMVSWYITEGPRGRTLPHWLSNTIIVVLLAWIGLGFMRSGELSGAVAALGRFLLWLLIIKLYSRPTVHEERQRLSLATMLVIAGCLESVQFAFGALVVLYVALAVWTAMLWRLHRSYEHGRSSRAASQGFAPPLEIAFGRRATPQFRGMTVTSVLFVFVASAGVFLLFPRIPTMLDTRGPRGARSVTGFSDEISLRGGDRISESRRELFVVRWLDPTREPVLPARPLLLRGAVLDRYDPAGERWLSARSVTGVRTIRTPTEERFVSLGVADGDAPGSVYTAEFEMRALATDVVFTLYAPVALSTTDSRTITFDPATFLIRDASSNRASRYWSYALRVQPQPSGSVLEDISGGSSSASASASRALQMPVPEIRPVAEQILAEARKSVNMPAEPGPDADEAQRFVYQREVARGIADWMQRNFTYTTDLSSIVKVSGEDPIVSFLTRYRRGHCEYFASGLCAVLRSLGIESRIITGYIAMEFDEATGLYTVRESNAHAWVEVRTGPYAWTAVDATPEDSLRELQEQNRSFADNFRWLYGTIEFLWNSRVVSYDSTTQAAIADRVQSGWRTTIGEWLTALNDSLSALTTRLSLGQAGGAWLAAIGVGVLTAVLAPTLLILRQRRIRHALKLDGVPRARRRMLLREAAFYAEALSELSRAGFAKPEHVTPREHARALAERNPDAGRVFAAVAEEFYRIRFGDWNPPAEHADEMKSRMFALRQALRQNPVPKMAD
ncbi:MAG: Protein-glutamine gamma-glutamyltransferase [Planctomycetota bacterium]